MIIDAQSSIEDAFENLKGGDLEDAGDNMSALESEIGDLESAIPCEDGIIEVVGNGGDDLHDECYNAEDVALTAYDHDTQDAWTLNRLALIPHTNMGELLAEIMSESTWLTLRPAIYALIEVLNREDYELDDAADVYIPADYPFTQERLAV